MLRPLLRPMLRVHCRIGSSEIELGSMVAPSGVHCRIGSSENFAGLPSAVFVVLEFIPVSRAQDLSHQTPKSLARSASPRSVK